MSEKIVSPGVFTKEIDQSFIPAALGDIGAAVVGPTVKGPVLTPTVVSSYGEYVQTFGELIESGSDKFQYLTSHTAQEYLRQGGPLTVVRVADKDAAHATANVGGGITGGTVAVAATQTLTISKQPADAAAITLAIGGQTTQTITFEDAAGDSEDVFQADNEALIKNTNFDGMSDSAAASAIGAVVTGIINGTHASGIGTARTTAIAATHDGAGVVTLTATGSITSYADIVLGESGDSGGAISIASATTGVTGVDGTDTTNFTLETLGAGPTFNSMTASHDGVFGTDNLLPIATASAGNDHFAGGNFGGRPDNFRWEVSERNLNKGTFTLLIRQGNDTTRKKQILETHSNLSLDPESTDYLLKRVGNQTNTFAVEDGVAYLQPTGEYPNKSKYVRVSALPENKKTPNYLDANGVTGSYGDGTSFIPGVGSGSYGGAFSGGTFGSEIKHPFNFYLADETDLADNSQGIDMSDSAVNVTGTTAGGGYMNALSLLANKDEYNFNLLFLPGVIDQQTNHASIITKAIDVCETRTDCFLVVDGTKKTGTISDAKTSASARNSSYAAAYYPWVQIQDNTSGAYRFVPPSVVIAGVYHFNDVVGQPWFAPAGLNRGGIDSAIQAYRKLTQGNRDDLYNSNVNPIATFPGQGVTVFGQKTLQKKASALDRVNVRRLLINIKSFISRSSRLLVFEQNTSDLRDQFLNTVNPFLEQVQSNSGINAFRVVMDDTNNTPETIDRNQLIGQIFVQPTRTAEFIILDFIVQPTGAAFPE